jgi:hydroxymethylpyrimidine/phosphomethylpyrimidine kinase
MTIAGSDSGAGAGIQADLKTFAAHGVYGTSALTAVTAQNTCAVSAYEPVSCELISAQIAAVAADIGVHAAKTGMLPSAAVVRTVAEAVASHGISRLVVDPVMIAKSGDRLVDEDALEALRSSLLPHAELVTPNLPEAEALARITIRDDDDRREAARRIHRLGARAVIIKGGHAPSRDIVDLLYDGERFTEFRTERVEGRNTHGTGCAFSAALTAHLARGGALLEAIPLVQEYVAGAIRHGVPVGRGHGPMNHFWRLY